jgi:hypothetical protein
MLIQMRKGRDLDTASQEVELTVVWEEVLAWR